MQSKRMVERTLAAMVSVPGLRGLMIAGHGALGRARVRMGMRSSGWERKHPFDALHGVRTSGRLPHYLLGASSQTGPDAVSDRRFGRYVTIYAAVQPSIVRTALAKIPNAERISFVDVGCGKGRALLIAAEFGFKSITGIELSPTLAEVARRNVNEVNQRRPGGRPVRVVTGNALSQSLPNGSLALFLYHPFGACAMRRLSATVESLVKAGNADIYVIYYNAVCASVWDGSDVLERRYAAQLPCDRSEIGFGPNDSDSVVIWQNRGNPHRRPAGNWDAEVKEVIPGWRAEVQR